MIGDFVRYKGNIYEVAGPFGKDKNLVRAYSSDPKDAAYGFEPSKADGEYTKLIPLSEVTEYYSEYHDVIYKGRCFAVMYEDGKKIRIKTKYQFNVTALDMEPIDFRMEGHFGEKWVSRDEVQYYIWRQYEWEKAAWDTGASKDENRPLNAAWSVYQGKAYLTEFSADDWLILHSFDEADVQKGFKRYKESSEQAVYYKYVLPGEVQKLYREFQYLYEKNAGGLLIDRKAGKRQLGFRLCAGFEEIKKDFAAEPKWEDINYGTVWIDDDQIERKDEWQKIYSEKIQSSGWLQKVIPFASLQKCFAGKYTGIRGLVYAVQDVANLQTYESIYDGLRLDQRKEDGSLAFAEPVFGVIRFTTGDGDELCAAYSSALGGNSLGLAPFTGTGFTAARNGQVIPEWEFYDQVSIEAGAQLYRVEKGKGMELIGRYDGVLRRFVPCREPQTTEAMCKAYGMLAGALHEIVLEKWSQIYLYVENVDGKLAVYFVIRLAEKPMWLRSDELYARYGGDRQGYEDRMKKITEGVMRARKAYQDANGEGWYRMNYLLDHERGISVEYGYEDVSQIPVQEKILSWMRKYHIG